MKKVFNYLKRFYSFKEKDRLEKERETKRNEKWKKRFREKYIKKHGKEPSKLETEIHVNNKNITLSLIMLAIVIIGLLYKLWDLIINKL